MFNNFVQWIVLSSYPEILGSLVIIAFSIGVFYILYEVIKYLGDLYVRSKLVELYEQKNRLWQGVNDAYDNYGDLSEKFWDYDVTKERLNKLTKDLAALEEYVLGENDEQDDTEAY